MMTIPCYYKHKKGEPWRPWPLPGFKPCNPELLCRQLLPEDKENMSFFFASESIVLHAYAIEFADGTVWDMENGMKGPI